jgi:hypothetical protein
MLASPFSGWRITALALALAVFAAPAQAAEVNKYLPNDSEVVWTLNVKLLLDSPLFKKVALDQLKKAIQGNDEAQKVMDALGFDPFKDINAIIAAGPSPDAKALKGSLADKGLVIVQGRFNVNKIDTVADQVAGQQPDALKIHKSGSARIYEVTFPTDNGKQTVFASFIDGGNLAISPAKDYVQDALDKSAGRKRTTLKKDLEEMLARADGKQCLSVAVTGNVLSKADIPDEQLKQVSDKINRISGGISVMDDVKIEFSFGTKNGNDAKVLNKVLFGKVNQLKGVVLLLAGNQQELAPLVDTVNTLKVGIKGSDVTIGGQVTRDAIEAILKTVGKQ